MPIDSSDIVQKPYEAVPTSLEDMAVIPAEDVAEDFICGTVEEDEGPDNVLKAVMGGLAEEQASLRVLRKDIQKKGKDTSHISLKRGTLLKYMSETILQRKSLMGPSEELNLRGIKFREVFKMFLAVISDTFDQVKIPPEYRELFFQKLGTNLEGWEDKAEKVVRAVEAPK